MQRSSLNALASILSVASCLCAPGVIHAQTIYTLTQVGTNDGTTSSSATSLNDEGDVALTVESGSTVATYLWHRGTQTNIGGLVPAPQFVESGGISDLVQIVGTTLSPETGTFCAFTWQRGQMIELPSPTGSTAAFGMADNLLGQVVGVVFDANSNGEAALWNKGKLTLLPGIPGGNFSQAEAINIRGEIVGTSQDASGITNAVLWRHGALTVLANNAVAGAINDENQVVGTIFTPPVSAFLWQNGTTTALPPLAGTVGSTTASGINDVGQMVGTSSNTAVLWQNGVAINLNDQIAQGDPLKPYVTLHGAGGINNFGQIVATGTDARSPAIGQAYLLTPVR
jgi:probable HAF family extracellular repeat protein